MSWFLFHINVNGLVSYSLDMDGFEKRDVNANDTCLSFKTKRFCYWAEELGLDLEFPAE
ncbi:MAG: hypothetical protein GF364_16800 [Candidatus Lokiarchaeota archaeon]|nr:hypothetical protein [Candidatus Lokiarchaeota archaeon]